MLETVLVEAKLAEAAQTTQYTAPVGRNGVGAFRICIEKFTVSPPPAGSATMAINIVPNGTIAQASNLVMPARTLQSTDRAYTCPELVGHILEPGDSISTLPSTATLVIRVVGRFLPVTP